MTMFRSHTQQVCHTGSGMSHQKAQLYFLTSASPSDLNSIVLSIFKETEHSLEFLFQRLRENYLKSS